MLSKRPDQRGLLEADPLYLDLVGPDSFYGRLVALLQAHDRVSDAETHIRAAVDLSWKVALGVEVWPDPEGPRQSALQHFRAQLMMPCEDARYLSTQLGTGPDAESATGANLASGPGHDANPGTRGREGHLQSAGGRHPPTAAHASAGTGHGAGPRPRGRA